MKSIYKKIEISPYFLLLIFLSLISGLFKDIFSLFLIIIIHELGHIIMSLIYKWNINKVKINIYGGYIIYNENIDKSFKEEFLIAISGILMQCIFYLLLYILNKVGILDLSFLLIVKKYHYSILIFNLLPIIPLDGSKVLNVLLNKIFSYKKSLYIINSISLLFIILFIILLIIYKLKIELSYVIILSFIMSSIIKNINDIPYLFNKFLFERYKYPIKNVKTYYIKNSNIENMRRQRINYFYINNTYKDERYLLLNRYIKL